MTEIRATNPPQTKVPARRTFIWRFLQVICRVATSVLWDLKVYGRGNVPAEGGAILAANHQSYLDPVLVAVQLTRPVSFMAKSELFKNAAFSWLIRQLNAFPIHQGKGDRAAINETIERLKEGHMLTLFAEGHRTSDGEIQEIQPGIALVARRAGVPVIPVVIEGSFAAWPRSNKLPRPGKIRVMYGKPIDCSAMKSEEIVKAIDAALRIMMAELRAMEGK
jgi:1-acyl-sn-glycerol-3-phosphate acyltransferase